MTDVTVELSDLRGWAAQTGRGSADLGAAHGYASSHIADADFGAILELITGDYAALLPKMHGILESDSSGMGQEQRALSASADAYQDADRQGRDRFVELGGSGALHASDDGVANGFEDGVTAQTKLTTPSTANITLPEVSFGWILDKVCELVIWVGGPDPREYVTKWIAGDVNKATMQAIAWECVAACVEAVEANLKSGSAAIARTWMGPASAASATQMGKWSACLVDQAAKMRQMSAHLKSMVDQAVKMAQVVVDIIKTVIDVVSAGLSNAAIPLYGQWKLINSVKQAITMINNARKVITVFWDVLKLVVDTIKMCASAFNAESLPPAPATAPAPTPAGVGG
ncbi:hypothetical protein [Actinokineospora iranica]|uniref:Uncharacterized protein n=1 Tax=Actinokineospora iranica TaxID=1271860 RepID=A0A1G6J3A4_9PSEU|nr:hypothetical protein [Actinokineospora iranica]SDC13201.1 hypothetical protein SAMN05216174_101216 [Actinokineospora iranica]